MIALAILLFRVSNTILISLEPLIGIGFLDYSKILQLQVACNYKWGSGWGAIKFNSVEVFANDLSYVIIL